MQEAQEEHNEISEELKKLNEDMDRLFREMCRTSPALLASRNLKSAM